MPNPQPQARYRIVVEERLCVSNAMCVSVAPEYFELGEDGVVKILREEFSHSSHELVEEAAKMCPTGAIRLERVE